MSDDSLRAVGSTKPEASALVPAQLDGGVPPDADNLNIGGDKLIQVTSELPDDQKETIRWLFSLAKSQKWSLVRLARETGIDNSTLYRVFTGQYAVLTKITQRIDRYRRQFEDQAQRSRGENIFIETSVTKKIDEGCEFARNTKTIVFIYGPTQIGKTTAALEHMANHNHGSTKYLRMPASAGVQLMMKEFARACFCSPNSSFENLREYVLNAIDSSHLVLIDELHEVFLSYQRGSAIKCLEVIREVHDRTGCGMVLFGTYKLRAELMMGQHLDLLEQFKERGVLEIFLPQEVPKKDIVKIAHAFGLGDPDEETAAIVDTITKGHGLKRYVLFLKSGRNLAKTEGRRMTWSHFISAHDRVAKFKENGKGKR